MKSHKWTEQEIQYLKNNYHLITPKQIATNLKISIAKTRNKAERLGLISNKMWTKEQLHFLKENYSYGEWDNLISFLKKKKATISAMARKLKLKKLTRKNLPWSAEQIEILKQYYPTCDNKWLANQLGKSVKSICTMSIKYNLYKKDLQKNIDYKLWTKEEEDWLKENSFKKTIYELSSILGRSIPSLYHKIEIFKLTTLIPESSLEIIFKEILDSLKISYLREVSLDNYRIDFIVNNIPIEINGGYWHCDPRLYNKPKYEKQKYSILRDELKIAKMIIKYNNYAIFWEKDLLERPNLMKQKLIAVLNGNIKYYDSSKSVEAEIANTEVNTLITKGKVSP